MIPYHRAEVHGLERIPAGPGLYVGNHSAGSLSIDTIIFATAVLRHRGLKDLPWALAHDLLVDLPVWNQLLVPLGAVRARPEHASALLERGQKILVYPGGELDALRPFCERNRIKFGTRRGYIRTALRHAVPIIPLITAGAHETFLVIDDLPWLAQLLGVDERLRIKSWPLVLSLPWGLTLGPPPPHLPLPTKIRIEVLEPITFSPSGEQAAEDAPYVAACAERVEHTMQQALDRLSER